MGQVVIDAGTIIRVDNGHGWHAGRLAQSFNSSRGDTVILRRCNNCTAEFYPARTLDAVQVGEVIKGSRGTHAARGVLIGAVVGGPLGAVFGRDFIYAGKENPGGIPSAGALLGLLIGVVGGAGIGAALPPSLHWTTLNFL